MNRGNSTVALFLVLAASIAGVILAASIPSAVFPEIQFDRAIILADSGDLPAAQMLVGVTRPLESAAYSAMNVTTVRSTTTRGSAEIDVTFREGSDPLAGFELLNSAVGQIKEKLPAGTSIESRLLTSGTFPILDISLSSRDRSLPELTDIAQYDLLPSFHRIPGVHRVDMVGAKYREYVVQLDPAKMLQQGVTPDQVVTGLKDANVIESPGRVIDKHRMMLVVTTADLHDADQIAAIPVANVGGQPVYVRDIGHVELGIIEDYIRTASENGPAVLVGISAQPGANAVAISDAAHRLITQLRARYPDVEFSFSYDQALLVAESFASVRDAIVLGLVLSVVVVFLFTWSMLSAAVAAIVVPCTIAITFVVMRAVGTTFNMMSLGGLAAGIGLFIDDAIVMIEAIHRAHESGEFATAGVNRALRELARPLIASTATVIVVFAPLVFLSGVTGVFFRALALTLGAGLFVSLLLALFFNPSLEVFMHRLRRPAHREGPIYRAVRSGYLGFLKPFVQYPLLAVIGSAVALGGAYLLYRTIGTDYLPAIDEGGFVLDYVTPPQSTLEDTTALLAKIQHILKTTPEVAAFSRRTGTQLGFFLTESNRGDMSVRLKQQRSRDIYEVMDSIRARILKTVPNVEIEFSQVLQDLIGDLSGTPEPVVVNVFGAEQQTIESTAREIAARITRIPGLVDVRDGLIKSSPEEQIVVDETAAERYGLSAAQISTTLSAVIGGTVATQLRVGDRLLPVRVSYPQDYQRELALLPELLLRTPQGGMIPLSSVVRMNTLGETVEMDRERMRPVVRVTARVEGTDLGTAIANVKSSVALVALPPGVTVEYGGLYADQQTAFRQLELVLFTSIAAMFLVLIWEFRRVVPALSVLISALSCIVGSFILLRVTGMTMNISSFMGVIMVAGITAKNGILLLDHATRSMEEGEEARAALVEAAQIRLRPILMTTLATAAGLLPLALGLGAGARIQQPLALAVIGGLAFALLLSTPFGAGLYLSAVRCAETAAGIRKPVG